jgi:nucleoside-diphosphate-sugar epimerase
MLGLESELQSKAENTGLKLLILRPTLIYGCGLDTNISRLASWVRRFGFIPVNGKATGLRQPVHADDLAHVAVAALHFKGVLPRTLSLGGGETLSYSDMAIRIFSAMEKPVRLVRLPEWLFVSLIRFACRLRLITGVNPEMVKRQNVNLVSDDRAARELLDYDPRPFTPTVADFSLPNLIQ